MAVSNEWTEYHLTPRGWERGNERDDSGSGVTFRKRAPDAVETWRWTSGAQVDARGELEFDEGGIVVWSSGDAPAIAALRAQHGERPKHL